MEARLLALVRIRSPALQTRRIRQSKRCIERQPSSRRRELNSKHSRSVTVLRASPYSIRTTCRPPPAPSSDKDRWLSASSGDTGDLIATWNWRLYKESILKSEHWERRSSCSLLNLNGIRGLCIRKLNLTFDMLTDLHLKTAEQFCLVFTLPDYLRDLYKSFGNALDRFHDEPEYRLPRPARYVVDKQGIIRAADVNADYTIRPEPSETLRQLRMLTG